MSKPNVSLTFPVYRDEKTVEKVALLGLETLREIADEYEIVIVDDGSPDRSGEIADGLAERYQQIRVIHHPENRGYSAAIRSGLDAARYDWICQTDGDDEYDVRDAVRLIELRDRYDLVITFRYVKLYSGTRVFISWVYNHVVRFMFKTRYRDISTGLRLINRRLLDKIELQSDSPFIGAELTIKAMLMGHPVGEVGIQTFPREFGKGSSVSPANIWGTVKDLWAVYRSVFSKSYLLPPGRRRRR